MEGEVADIMGEWKMQPVLTRRFKCRSFRQVADLEMALNQFLVEL